MLNAPIEGVFFDFGRALKEANPGVQSVRRVWKCFEASSLNEQARHLNLPLKVFVKLAWLAYSQDLDMSQGSPLISIQVFLIALIALPLTQVNVFSSKNARKK